MGMSGDRNHLPALDGIRALAVFVVILYHSGAVQSVPGDLGVSAFFVLSGFLITWLLIKELDRTGTVSLRDFYKRRTLRIFPAYYAFVILSLIGDALLHHYWSWGIIGAAFTYTVNYYNAFLGHPTTSVAHAWSLAVEEQFYLLWPLLLLILWKKGRAHTRNVLALIVIGVLAWRAVLYIGFHVQSSWVYDAFDARCDALAIGCLMALCGSMPSYKSFESVVSRYAWLPIVTLLLVWLSRTAPSLDYHYTLGMTVESVLLAIFLVQMLRLSESRLWSWLNRPVIRWLGAISYPCYLWHGWGLDFGTHLVDHFVQHSPPLEFTAGYAITICLAAGSWYLIEQPFLAFKHRRLPSTVRLSPTSF